MKNSDIKEPAQDSNSETQADIEGGTEVEAKNSLSPRTLTEEQLFGLCNDIWYGQQVLGDEGCSRLVLPFVGLLAGRCGEEHISCDAELTDAFTRAEHCVRTVIRLRAEGKLEPCQDLGKRMSPKLWRSTLPNLYPRLPNPVRHR